MNKKSMLVFIFFIFSLIFPSTIKAYVSTRYEYKDISVCYIRGQDAQANRITYSGTGKYFCVPATPKEGVNKDKLESENACGVGYELYSERFDVGDPERLVLGYGCRRASSEYHKDLYCMYRTYSDVFQLYEEGKSIGVRRYNKYIGSGDSLPAYNDPNWINVSSDFEVDLVTSTASGVCPKLVVEKFNSSNKVVGLKFFDYEPSSNEDAFYGDYENYPYYLSEEKILEYTQKYDESGELEPSPNENNHYQQFLANEVDNIITNNTWNHKCYYLDKKIELYFNDHTFVMRANYSQNIDITANFTIKELLQVNGGKCPQRLYYALDMTLARFWLSDTDNGLYYRDMAKLDGLDEEQNPNLGDNLYGCEVIPKSIRAWIESSLNLVKYIALVIVIVLGVLDFLKAAGSGEAEAMKKAGTDFLKRIIAVIILFLLPLVVNLILNLIEIYGADSTCIG